MKRQSDKSEDKKVPAALSNKDNSSSEKNPKTGKTTEDDIPDWERELQEELQVIQMVKAS